MRRRPQDVPVTYNRNGPAGSVQDPAISRDPEVLQPFLASGGELSFRYALGPPLFDPAPDGVQLVTSVFIPPGRVGFLKQIRIAPFIPAVFSHPWQGWPGTWPVFKDFAPDDEPPAPGGQMGVWSTPFGWEAYIDYSVEFPEPVIWRWQLRILDGRIEDIKSVRNIARFDITNPESWYLTPNIAVPRIAYRAGLPGRAAGFPWGPQRVQVLQADQLSLHVPVTENKTLCLFAEWKQVRTTPVARNELGLIEYAGSSGANEGTYYPLLPSFGQLLGYTQIQGRVPSYENALHGWNG